MGLWNMFLLAGFLALFVNLLSVPMWWYGKVARARLADAYSRMPRKQFVARGVR